MKPSKSPVSEALIFVCEKCGKKLSSDPDKNPSRELQQALKEKIKWHGKKGQVRAVLGSCIDICPNGEIALGISWAKDKGGEDEFYTLKDTDESTADEILDFISKKSTR